jgi:putative transposase
MQENKITAQRGDKTLKRRYSKIAKPAPNRDMQQFVMDKPDIAWVRDITCIRTYQGWLYPTDILDLFSHKVIGWPMKSTWAKKFVVDTTQWRAGGVNSSCQ